jgi:integrase
MPRRVLTDKFCASASARDGEAQTDYFDTSVPGLSLRVSASRKAWSYLFTWGGKRVRVTLGTYPATSLAAARTRAEGARGDLEAGTDPRSALRVPDTLASVCEEWFTREGHRLRTGAYRKATLERLVLPTLGDRPIDQIRRSDIVRVLDRIDGAVMADQTLGYLRRVFTWYASRSDDFHSPIVRGMGRAAPSSERARERVLTDDELRAVWRASAEGAYGAFVRFLLLTGARRSEAARIVPGEIADGVWTLPAERNKTKVELARPLSTAAIATLPDGGVWPIRGNWTGRKARFDAACGVTDWTLHDLRRTARSLMSRAGVPADHAERCLGHVLGGVRGVYDRHRYEAEMARAYAALAAQIDRIINPSDNVISLRADARADANG